MTKKNDKGDKASAYFNFPGYLTEKAKTVHQKKERK